MSLSLQKNSAGVAQTISRLRQEFGVKIGSSTGYTSEIMAELKVRGDISNYPLSLYLPPSLLQPPRATVLTAT